MKAGCASYKIASVPQQVCKIVQSFAYVASLISTELCCGNQDTRYHLLKHRAVLKSDSVCLISLHIVYNSTAMTGIGRDCMSCMYLYM